MYRFIKIRHDILIQCHENYMEMKKINYMLEIDILRNSSQFFGGVLRGAFEGFGCPKRHPAGLDGPQKDQVGWRGYLNPRAGSPASISGSPATFFATIL